MTMNTKYVDKTLHSQCGKAVDMVMKSSLVRKSLDNVTCLMIAFKNFENCYDQLNFDKKKNLDKVPRDVTTVPQTAKNLKGKNFFSPDNKQIERNDEQRNEQRNEGKDKESQYTKEGRDTGSKEFKTDKKVSHDNLHLSLKLEDYKVNNERNDRNYTSNSGIYDDKQTVSLGLKSMNKPPVAILLI